MLQFLKYYPTASSLDLKKILQQFLHEFDEFYVWDNYVKSCLTFCFSGCDFVSSHRFLDLGKINIVLSLKVGGETDGENFSIVFTMGATDEINIICTVCTQSVFFLVLLL